ncbi:acyltransferase ChoActase/COT/CPT [Wallemia mellicola]|uniref:Acyltransferase ChoActase/COT/CPT n=1 Tax=Wallemia mellicola TaxID=1708541 RepID=A0A4T0TJQ3_9BASI|nr:acyltransferase ChoActase/COT/CPT [Wallemia mellicola]
MNSVVPHVSNHKLKLPELPVPPLEQTAQRLLESAKVLTTDENQIKTLELRIASFLANEDPKLQSRLEEYKKDPRNLLSLEQIWDDANYMEYRDSTVVNVSFFYGFVPTSQPLSGTQYAARIAHYALQFRKTLFDGQLDPDFIGKDKSPLCMNSYRFMFDACRIPCKPADYVNVNRQKIGHVAVVHKGNWWSIPATTADGTPLSVSELEQKIDYIINQPVKEGFVGVLTTRNRDKWADIDPTNADSLAEIESAAFVIALDGTQTLDTPVTKSRHLWHAGDGGKLSNNRFVDKPAQFICWTDQSSNTARGGLIGEHSAMDGTPIVRFCEFILENIEKFLHRLEEPVDRSIANARTDNSMQLHQKMMMKSKYIVKTIQS